MAARASPDRADAEAVSNSMLGGTCKCQRPFFTDVFTVGRVKLRSRNICAYSPHADLTFLPWVCVGYAQIVSLIPVLNGMDIPGLSPNFCNYLRLGGFSPAWPELQLAGQLAERLQLHPKVDGQVGKLGPTRLHFVSKDTNTTQTRPGNTGNAGFAGNLP